MTCCVACFFFNDTATTEIYTYGHTLSLHDALPIFAAHGRASTASAWMRRSGRALSRPTTARFRRSVQAAQRRNRHPDSDVLGVFPLRFSFASFAFFADPMFLIRQQRALRQPHALRAGKPTG